MTDFLKDKYYFSKLSKVKTVAMLKWIFDFHYLAFMALCATVLTLFRTTVPRSGAVLQQTMDAATPSLNVDKPTNGRGDGDHHNDCGHNR